MSMLFKRIKDWATSITSFRAGDVIPVDGPSGTAKMPVSELPTAIFGNSIDEAVAAWLDEHPEATTTVQDGSLTESKFSDNLKLLAIKDYLTPEMFGAVGDYTTDDTAALQDFFNALKGNGSSEKIGVLTKNYLISDTILVGGNDLFIYGFNSYIKYTGNGSAIKITNCKNSHLEFNYIVSNSGDCLEIYSGSNSEPVSYLDLFCKHLRAAPISEKADSKCIYIHRDTNGYCNEIRLNDVWLGRGKYGIYVGDSSEINNVQCFSIGIEGVDTGIHFSNNNHFWTFFGIRTQELNNLLIECEGSVSDISFFDCGPFEYGKCSFSSSSNRISFFGRIGIFQNETIPSSRACIVYGEWLILDPRRTGRVILPSGVSSYDMTDKSGIAYSGNSTGLLSQCPRYFVLNEDTAEIKLNFVYCKYVETFFIKLAGRNNFVLKDYSGNPIFTVLEMFSNDKSALLRVEHVNYCWIITKVDENSVITNRE